MIKIIGSILIIFIISIGVDFIWIGLELIFYGEKETRIVDTIVGIFLSASIFLNLYKLGVITYTEKELD